MRRTAALAAAALLLLAVLGPVSSDGAAAGDSGPAPSATPVAGGTATPQVSAQPAEVEVTAAPRAEGQPDGQAEGPDDAPTAQEERTRDGGAVASQRPALTAVLDPGAGATIVAPGAAVAGSGPTHRYSVEVEPALGLDIDLVRSIVEEALHDVERSWARTRTLQRVDDPQAARIRVVLASPETVDAICATVGLNTAGIFSCWTGRIAALNAWRWEVGAAGFPDVESYRTYLINHEFGHALGYGHLGCPAAGSLAPVMMQQSKGLAGCTANGWPYP
jgi:hypothetical protein